MIKGDRFSRPVAGYSLTQPKGKFPWDSPPRQVDPQVVVSKIIDNMEKERNREGIVKLMYAGISIEEILNTVGMAGFAEGEFTPDVAEMIKAPLALYMLGMADEYDIPVKLFGDEKKRRQKREGIDDGTILDIMRVRNPDFSQFVEGAYYDKEEVRDIEMEQKQSQGFLAVEPGEVEEQ